MSRRGTEEMEVSGELEGGEGTVVIGSRSYHEHDDEVHLPIHTSISLKDDGTFDLEAMEAIDVEIGSSPELHRRRRVKASQLQNDSDSNGTQDSVFSQHSNISNTSNVDPSDQRDALILFGVDITHFPPNVQFYICAAGVFGFTVIYGQLQEQIAVHIAGRKLALFLATCQFAGYAFWSFVLTHLRVWRLKRNVFVALTQTAHDASAHSKELSSCEQTHSEHATIANDNQTNALSSKLPKPPLLLFLGLSVIRSADLGLTNGAMKYLNYPAKTLIKSSRVVFTMILGILIGKKRYSPNDYFMVGLLVTGLGIFLHADMVTSAVFHPFGVLMLIFSLLCDGMVANYSELIMTKYTVSQDEFQLSLYTISFLVTAVATLINGEFFSGFRYFFLQPGTVTEIDQNLDVSGALYHHHRMVPTWTVLRKITILLLFTTTGLFGSSCAGAITKRFGALSMSTTSTSRKAATLFLSLAAKGNVCTLEHVIGVVVFMLALVMKSLNKSAIATASGRASSCCNHGDSKEKLDDEPYVNTEQIRLLAS